MNSETLITCPSIPVLEQSRTKPTEWSSQIRTRAELTLFQCIEFPCLKRLRKWMCRFSGRVGEVIDIFCESLLFCSHKASKTVAFQFVYIVLSSKRPFICWSSVFFFYLHHAVSAHNEFQSFYIDIVFVFLKTVV